MKNNAYFRGFTLVEILITLFIFAILSVLAVNILSGSIRQYKHIQTTQQQLLNIQRTFLQMNHDIMQIVHRQNKSAYGEVMPSLVIDKQQITVLSGGWRNYLGKTRSNLEHVRYELVGQDLLRRTWQVLDPKIEADSKERIYLSNVDQFSVELRNEKHQKIDQYKTAKYVIIRLTITGMDEQSYRILLPDYV